ncbi:MAG: TonB-dependent receptor [Prevotella sp.]|nr:TonB-dependent receptor [Prevotella sp.]
MHRKLILPALALWLAGTAWAQEPADSLGTELPSEQAYTFTEAQLGDDDNVTQNISIVGSQSNVYASQVGYRFSAARFKYRALGAKYNDIYINGNPVNDVERGEFRYSFVGGLNNQTRGVEQSLPLEEAQFAPMAIGGANNYNFRPSAFSTGSRASLAGANRNYTARAMYTYNTGLMQNGWAFSGALTYRWAKRGYVDGTFYNALSYFLGAEKVFGCEQQHHLSLVTWGNPTERATMSASTDEMYWIANDRFYNPNWGYQNGKKRSSRVVKDFAPAALLTWDYRQSDQTKWTTSLLWKYSKYSSSRLNYNNSTNPAPDYYSLMPSYYFDVWGGTGDNDAVALASWNAAYSYLSASKQNRQINWDRLYYANRMMNAQGAEAMYYLQAYHDDQLSLSLASTLNQQIGKNSQLNLGLHLSTNKGMHYQTMEDLLGAQSFRNVNTYVTNTYGETSAEAQYDMLHPNRAVRVGDRFGYDYNIIVEKAQLWTSFSSQLGLMKLFASGRVSGQTMRREGKMMNGLAPDNSYGFGRTAKFLDGGARLGLNFNFGRGGMLTLGGGMETKAPQARNAFQAAQVNNDFVKNLKNEKILSAELGYNITASWLHASVSAYYNKLSDVAESSMLYFDTQNSFSYVSLTGIKKEYRGVELGLDFRLTSWLNLKALGTISEAKYTNNANVRYMLSQDGLYHDDLCLNEGMREGGTPLTAGSLNLSYHAGGWFIDLYGNYYDRIYLYYTPVTRYASQIPSNNDGTGPDMTKVPEQAEGHGGFMLDASIGKSIYLRKGRRMSFNLMLTNILNNLNIVTGGQEQNRQTADETGSQIRTYNFEKSPKKFYANGINGMFIITYNF